MSKPPFLSTFPVPGPKIPLTLTIPEPLSPGTQGYHTSLLICPQLVIEEQSERRREGAAGSGKAGRERQEGGHGVGKKARADRPGVRREETGMGRCRDCEGVQYGEVGPGDSEELRTRELGPHSPRSSMAGHRQTTLGEQGGDRVRRGGGGGGGERTSGSWRPSHDHVRKPGPVGMGLEVKWGE